MHYPCRQLVTAILSTYVCIRISQLNHTKGDDIVLYYKDIRDLS